MSAGDLLYNKKIIYISGKGGVGKSSIAASLAIKFASIEEPGLLVELGDESFYDNYLEGKAGQVPIKVVAGLDRSRWTGIETLSGYVDHLVKWRGLGKAFFENPIMENLLKIAPGLYELAILGKLSSGVRNHGPKLEYSKIILDSFSTGHSLAMLRAPKVMAETISMGPMHNQSRDILDCLQNKEISQFLVVTNCEEMAMEEALEHCYQLRSEFNIEPLLVLNRCLKEFSLIPDLDMGFESFLFYREEEQKKARDLAKSEGFSFLESEFIFNAESGIDLYKKIGDNL